MGQCLTCNAPTSGASQKCDRCAAPPAAAPRLPPLASLDPAGDESERTMVSRPAAAALIAPPVFTPPPQGLTLIGTPALNFAQPQTRDAEIAAETAKTLPIGQPLDLNALLAPVTSPLTSAALGARSLTPTPGQALNPFSPSTPSPLTPAQRISPQETMPGHGDDDEDPPSLSGVDELPPEAEDSFSSMMNDFTEILDEIKSVDMSADDVIDHTVDIDQDDLYEGLEGADELTPPPRKPPPPLPPAGVQAPSRAPLAPPALPPRVAPRVAPLLAPPAPSAGARLFVLSDAPQALPVSGELVVGSRLSQERFSDLSPEHFRLIVERGEAWVEPAAGADVWLRVRRAPLAAGQECRVGRTRLRLARRAGLISSTLAGDLGGLSEGLCLLIINERGDLDGVFNLPPRGVTRVGRALADLALKDTSVSLRHLALRVDGERVEAVDLESEGGVWLKLTARTALAPTDIFSAGHSLFAARA